MTAPGESAGAGERERAAVVDQVLAWSVVGTFVVAIVALLVWAAWVGQTALITAAGVLAVIAIRPALGAWTMSQASGRFVDRALVMGSSGR